MEVPGEATFVDGELAACDSAVVEAPADSTVLWFLYAAFPSGSSPRLKVVTFGCQFDADSVGLLWAAPRPGSSELRYEPTASWPYPGSGTMMGFAEALTDSVDEIYCFAGYGPEGETFAVVANPDSVQGGVFADDGTPSTLDSIADFGSLGFGMAGWHPCPTGLDGSQTESPSESGSPAEVEPGDPMVLSHRRWPCGVGLVDVLLGRTEVCGVDRYGVESLVEQAADTWSDLFAQSGASVSFNLLALSQYQNTVFEWREPDGVSTVCWNNDANHYPVVASVWAWPDYAQRANYRIAEMDMQFYGSLSGYRWLDCPHVSGSCLPVQICDYDVTTVALHEWGHAAAGLEDMGYCGDQSIMCWESAHDQCHELELQSIDIDYGRWSYDGLSFDHDEPSNDYLNTPCLLSPFLESYGDEVDNDGLHDRLPGYYDVDVFEVEVVLDSGIDVANLEFGVIPLYNTEYIAGVKVYQDRQDYLGTYESFRPGEDVFGTITWVSNHRYEFMVYPVDDKRDAPGDYYVIVQLLRPSVSGAPQPPAASDTTPAPDLHVDQMAQCAFGSPLRTPAVLQVFSVDGRMVCSRDIPSQEAWRVSLGTRLPSGVYMLRLTDGARTANGRIVVVR
jgi:hypothetical protein